MENTQVVFKRKFRWLMEASLPAGKIKPVFIQMLTRPQIEIEEINYLSTKWWIPGKCKWEQINFTVIEFEETNYQTIGSAFVENLPEDEFPKDKLGTFKLSLLDGCGTLMESWELKDAVITTLALSGFTSHETQSLELTVKYKSIEYKSENSFAISPTTITQPKTTCPNCKHEFEKPMPNIYGIKTPEKHKISMGIGEIGKNHIMY